MKGAKILLSGILVAGSIGEVSGQIGADLMEVATTPAGTPFEITEITVTVGPPPDQALAPKAVPEKQKQPVEEAE